MLEFLGRQAGLLAFAVRFFTILPAPLPRHDTRLADTTLLFPFAGLVVAILPAFVWYVAASAVNSGLGAVLAILVAIVISGALHEDGLADSADALGAGDDREKAFEIMSDSRVGAFGVLALIGSFVIRVYALGSLGIAAGCAALFVAHAVSRAAIVLPLEFSRYAKPEGLGRSVDGDLPEAAFMASAAIAFFLAFLIAGFSGVLAAAFAYANTWMLMKFLDRRYGGYTGDGLGATQQIAELTIWIILAGLLS